MHAGRQGDERVEGAVAAQLDRLALERHPGVGLGGAVDDQLGVELEPELPGLARGQEAAGAEARHGRRAERPPQPLLEELRRRHPPRSDAPHPAAQVLRSGEPELVSEIDDEMLQALARDEEHLRLLREAGFTSYMLVPLVLHGEQKRAQAGVTAVDGQQHKSAQGDESIVGLQTICGPTMDSSRYPLDKQI